MMILRKFNRVWENWKTFLIQNYDVVPDVVMGKGMGGWNAVEHLLLHLI
jgi:hypothetical protein